MKQHYLKNKITINFFISAILGVLASGSIYYRLHQEQASEKTINTIKSEILHLETQKEELENKIVEIKKYRKVFKTLTAQRKDTSGINFDTINSKLELVSMKYNVDNSVIKVSFPENLTNGVFNMSSIAMVSSSVNLSFNAISDVEALSFISEFLDSLPGYTVVNDISIKKTKEYTSTDLISISSGRKSGNISGQVQFYWYVYKQGRQ